MSNKSMGSRKQQMVMRDELYVDRRIKIFEVKKKGPTFDVKKIAADLKAKSQKRMAHRQTKSDFINSIMLKTTVPVMKRRVVDVTPMETTTISSDEDDDDLSITCNLQIKALLTPELSHSFTVPVDISCRTKYSPSSASKPQVSPIKASYSVSDIPRRFDCFVKLDRIPPEPPKPATVPKPVDSCANAEEPMDTTGPCNVKLEHGTDHQNLPAEETTVQVQATFTKETENQTSSAELLHDRSSSFESSFDIKVEPSMPTIDTPPPEPHFPGEQEAMVQIPTATEVPRQRPPPPKLVRILPKNEVRIQPRPPTPAEEPVRPVIKLRNINELLEARQPQLINTSRILESFRGPATQEQPVLVAQRQPPPYYQPMPSNQMVPTGHGPAHITPVYFQNAPQMPMQRPSYHMQYTAGPPQQMYHQNTYVQNPSQTFHHIPQQQQQPVNLSTQQQQQQYSVPMSNQNLMFWAAPNAHNQATLTRP